MSLMMEQDSSLIQDRLASRENFQAMASLNEVSAILKREIEENSRRSAPTLASPSALQFPGMSQYPGTQINVTLKHPEKSVELAVAFPDELLVYLFTSKLF